MPDPAQVPYGGQAVIEGVMIRGPRFVTLSCRLPQADGSPGLDTPIDVHTERIASPYARWPWLRGVPLVRGVVSLFEMLSLGLRCLQRSANLALPAALAVPWLPLLTAAGDESEGGALQTPTDKAGALNGPLLWTTIAVSFAVGVALFVVLPHALASWICRWLGIESNVALNGIEGVLRLYVFVAYVAAIGQMKDIKRVFAYHGAEHKVVNAWEARNLGDESPVTLEEALPNSVIHPRCGTNFAFIVVMMSIILFTFLPPADSFLLRIGYRIAALPVVAAVSFELLKLVGRFRSVRAAQALVAPGLVMQRLTTREPSPDMVEVALASLAAVREAEQGGELRCERLEAAAS